MLEVGLGGRLDAVNAVDADCAVLTSVGIDHVEYLGATREAIGREKAGIFRAGAAGRGRRPGSAAVGARVRAGARLLLIGRDFGYRRAGTAVGLLGSRRQAVRVWRIRRCAARSSCATPARRWPRSIACASDCRWRCRTSGAGWPRSALPGRFQVLPGRPQVVLDVAHNPEAAAVLAANLGDSGFAPETIAVFGMLRDKDIAGVVRAMAPRITRWHLATLPGPRGAERSLRLPRFSSSGEYRGAGVTVPDSRGGARRGEEGSGRE